MPLGSVTAVIIPMLYRALLPDPLEEGDTLTYNSAEYIARILYIQRLEEVYIKIIA